MKKSELKQIVKEELDNLISEESINEDLRKWFKEKWVNIGKTNKSGKHPPCGTSGEEGAYAKCVPASKAAKMSKKEKESAVRRKRYAQKKAGRAGRGEPGEGPQGQKPIMVKTMKEINESIDDLNDIVDELKKASKMHLSQAERIKSHIKAMGQQSEDLEKIVVELKKASKMHLGQSERVQAHVKTMLKQEQNENATLVTEKNIPLDPKKWAYYVGQAKKKFDVYPSAYANAWAAKKYKAAGGKWTTEKKNEAVETGTFKGKQVKLNKPMRTGKDEPKKFKVYVMDKGKVKMVRFGHQGGGVNPDKETMTIKKDDPERRKSFRARHRCDTPGPKTKARYWSCKMW